MSSSKIVAGKKRPADGQLPPRNTSKRRKPDIAVQNGQPGEINIANFVKAREFEIKALETNMKAMRKSLSSRAFQQLPRHMRRRTASHNVKKVPRRLRKRAIKEVKEDNTPTVSKRTRTPSRKLRLRLETAKSLKKRNLNSKKSRRKKKKDTGGKDREADKETDPEKRVSMSRVPKIKKNTLARPPTATTKYKRRQVNKAWLPTHLWHAKRAQMTRPTEPLWRLAIPLRPTEKSYRPTHRAAGARGCIAWDTSYMSTVACMGTEHTLTNLLDAMRFASVSDKPGKLKRWKAGTRFAEGFVHETGTSKRLLGPALVLWAPIESHETSANNDKKTADRDSETKAKRNKIKLDRRIFIRIHPSMFKKFWTELLRAAKMQKPQVLVEDLRFEIGSIQVTGPASTESLLGVLRPRHSPEDANVAAKTWSALAGLNNPGSLPEGAILAFDIVDPRLSHPPKQIKVSSDQQSLDNVTELSATWPPDDASCSMTLASYKARWLASAKLPAQKSINRRRAEAGPGKPIPVLGKDPPIPVVLLAHRAPGTASNAQGTWTVMLPWCCIDAVWRSLQYYPISSGSTPRFGGLYQMQQLAFEQMAPWFPANLPGTEAGKVWERTESEKRFDAWMRRPPGRRLQWDMVDIGMGRKGELGRGWMCDWEFLIKDTEQVEGSSSDQVCKNGEMDHEITETAMDNRGRRNTSSPETTPEPEAEEKLSDSEFYQLPPNEAAALLNPRRFKKKALGKLGEMPAIATVRIRLLIKGTPQSGARIYRLPAPELLDQPQTDQVLAPPAAEPPTQRSLPPASLPASAEAHTATAPLTSTSSAPPAAQRPPPSTQSDFTSLLVSPPAATIPLSLRERWLSLVPTTTTTTNKHLSAANPKASSYHHPLSTESHALSKINVFPPKASADLIAKFDTYPSEEQIAEFEHQQLLREVLKNDAVSLTEDGQEGKWDVGKGLVECPDPKDLIGFVTSGGFNLREGRGTAVGGIWCQRVVEGWVKEDEEEDSRGMDGRKDVAGSEAVQAGGRDEAEAMEVDGPVSKDGDRVQLSGQGKERNKGTKTGGGGGGGDGKRAKISQQAVTSEAEKAREKKIKERTLCIVRNSGSGVGRLGWWEVCE